MRKSILMIIATFAIGSCTSDFDKLNENPYGISEGELERIPKGGTQLEDLQKLIVAEQENSYQHCFDFIAGYGGYATPKLAFAKDFPVYNPRTEWIKYPFDDTYPKIYKSFFELKKISKGDKDKIYIALGSIYRVAITHWLTDTYGPLPYSQQKEGQDKAPYDSQKDLYFKFCEELTSSIETLKKVDPSNREYAPFDKVYTGDMNKWVKYANSLLLRIAIRMAKVAPTEAKMYAEAAIQSGVITTNAENALLTTSKNPVQLVSTGWNDSFVNADITEYMNAFSDPRREKYFTKVEGRTEGKEYFGMRNGVPEVEPDIEKYSKPNLKSDSPIVLFNAAEVAFLKAEGALNGWNMGGSTAKQLYEEGIKLSFDQYGVNIGEYLENRNQRGAFVDEETPAYNDDNFSSFITVNWDDAAGDTQKQLAKIITQKWIAMYPYGSQEAWAEWRRTGYPNLLPPETNLSGGVVTTSKQVDGKDVGGMRRLPFSQKEYSNNLKNIQEAVKMLGGNDNGATDMWWVK